MASLTAGPLPGQAVPPPSRVESSSCSSNSRIHIGISGMRNIKEVLPRRGIQAAESTSIGGSLPYVVDEESRVHVGFAAVEERDRSGCHRLELGGVEVDMKGG